jgi:hypothetical protein
VKLGADNRNKVIAAVSLVVVAGVLMATRFSDMFSLGSSNAAAPAPVNLDDNLPPQKPAPSAPRTTRGSSKKQTPAQTLDPTLRTDLLTTSEETEYQGTGRNIFRIFVDIPKPIAPVTPQPDMQAQGPPPPPPPPPIELKYYGYATPAGGTKRIFLAQGEDVFIAKEGEIVDRRYKVVRISPNAVEILDVLSNNRQSIPLTQG